MHKSKFLCLPFFLSCWKCLNFICGGDFLVQMFRRKLKVKKYKKLWAFVARIIWQIHFKFCYIFTLTTFFFLWKKIGLVFFYYHHYVWLLDLSEDPENPSMKVTRILWGSNLFKFQIGHLMIFRTLSLKTFLVKESLVQERRPQGKKVVSSPFSFRKHCH